MPHTPRTDLDHVGFIIPDLAGAQRLFAQLGFTLTTRADHTRRTPDGRTVSAGSAQHSVMFQRGYIELMQITDPTAGHQLTAAIHARYGLHVLALGSSDAQAWHARCVAQALSVGPLMDWSREVRTEERSGLARFRYFDSPWQASDPSYICWVQHLTPELVRSPSLVRHANTATALAGIGYAGPTAALEAWARRLVDSGAQATGQPGTLDLDGQTVTLRADASLAAVRPESLQIRMQDPQALARAATAAGLQPDAPRPGCVAVALGADYGLRLEAIAAG